MKSTFTALAIAALAFGGYVLLNANEEKDLDSEMSEPKDGESAEMETSLIPDGSYSVLTGQSEIKWSGKKPLIEGYINSGTLGLSGGNITISEATVSGGFEIDMNTLTVSETKSKPGQETTLEGHLKGQMWFNVAEFQSASFALLSVHPRLEESEMYDVSGTLTMKGVTGPLSFPAKIYMDDAGLVHAEAAFEFDRTKWGITAGSGSFFDNLADNAIDDMVAMSFSLVAELDDSQTNVAGETSEETGISE